MNQPIFYVIRSDHLTGGLSPTPLPPARNLRSLPSSWTENECPEVYIRGDIFQHIGVEVECKVSNKYHLPGRD